MENCLPKDPVMLLSYVNTQLRDNYGSLNEMCLSLGISAEDITGKLAAIDYEYDMGRNQFV